MLITKKFLDGIVAGHITLAFRRWKRPTVKPNGRLRTALGVLGIENVEVVKQQDITKRDALAAGYPSREDLLNELHQRTEGQLYRITLHYAGADDRHELRRQHKLSKTELADLMKRLDRMDDRSHHGRWTTQTLKLIADNPGKRAAELAERVGAETKRFKTNVRKLKELGLMESLAVGYRLSPRGRTVFAQRRLESPP